MSDEERREEEEKKGKQERDDMFLRDKQKERLPGPTSPQNL